MKANALNEFIYFFMHNKHLTKAQSAKRDALIARDMAQLASQKNNVELEHKEE